MMGLDNIPYEYPCIVEGLQSESEQIDCTSNIENHKCPWHREMSNAGNAMYGMLGTPCWFRGKAGNFMLNELADNGYMTPKDDWGGNITFYGDSEPVPVPGLGSGVEEEILSSSGCMKLAGWMERHVEAYTSIVDAIEVEYEDDLDTNEVMEQYRYAINWLKFVAPYGGSKVWY
jgi:hypothetical protein